MKQKVGYTYEFDASCANGALDNNFSECKRSVATYKLGNMKTKKSSEVTVTGSKKGDDLNYEFDYEVEEGRAHRYSRIGTRYYKYDEVGNLLAEQTGAFSDNDDDSLYKIEELKEKTYGMNEGWGVFNKEESAEGSKTHYRKTDRRTYEWNAENQLVETSDEAITVGYTYGADGKRASKYTHNSETLYFNDYWVWHIDNATKDRGGKVTKNIYLGTERLASRIGSYNTYAGEENENTFFYHSDHLGSAQLVTDCKGDEYQRIEYTPYGETWIDLKTQISLIAKFPYKFSAKELDEETGLYYYGARYLDPKYSRWISADPAMNTGEYFPVAPIDDEAKKHNQNLPGMGGVFNHINSNLYHYAANNPIKYTDPDGRDVDIHSDKEKILDFINKYSYYKYKIDENDHLIRDGNKINHGNTSKKYSAVIDAAIADHSKSITIIISDKAIGKLSNGLWGNDYDVEKAGGGGCTCNFSDTLKLVYITGRNSIYDIPMENGTNHKYTPEEILMHELVGHAIPELLNCTGGSAIFNENTIRKELGLDERKEMYNDPVIYNYMSNGRFLFMPNK